MGSNLHNSFWICVAVTLISKAVAVNLPPAKVYEPADHPAPKLIDYMIRFDVPATFKAVIKIYYGVEQTASYPFMTSSQIS